MRAPRSVTCLLATYSMAVAGMTAYCVAPPTVTGRTCTVELVRDTVGGGLCPIIGENQTCDFDDRSCSSNSCTGNAHNPQQDCYDSCALDAMEDAASECFGEDGNGFKAGGYKTFDACFLDMQKKNFDSYVIDRQCNTLYNGSLKTCQGNTPASIQNLAPELVSVTWIEESTDQTADVLGGGYCTGRCTCSAYCLSNDGENFTCGQDANTCMQADQFGEASTGVTGFRCWYVFE